MVSRDDICGGTRKIIILNNFTSCTNIANIPESKPVKTLLPITHAAICSFLLTLSIHALVQKLVTRPEFIAIYSRACLLFHVNDFAYIIPRLLSPQKNWHANAKKENPNSKIYTNARYIVCTVLYYYHLRKLL